MKKIHIGKKLLVLTIVLAALLVLGACSSTSSTATTSTSSTQTTASSTSTLSTTTTPGASASVDLTAQNMSFDKSTITVPAGAAVTINFNNKDSGIPHNFALYTNSSAPAPAIFQGQIITGPKTITYTFTAPSTPGNYFFRCDVHPTSMTGKFVVQ
jgi:plastocyanin